MTQKKSILDDLYTDSAPFDEEALARVLKTLVSIQREGDTIYFKNADKLTNEDKIIVFALVRKLLSMEGKIAAPGFSAKDAQVELGIKKGSIDPTIQKLKNDGLLVGKNKNYEVPHHSIDTVVRRLEKKLPKENL